MGCNSSDSGKESIQYDTLKNAPVPDLDTIEKNIDSATPNLKNYSNQRFKNVTVEQLSENRFRIYGQAKVFEASFSWVVEDGHNELYKGYEMTDAGAPAWGSFDFTIEAGKERENSTLTLILFEGSAKDGSRQYELPISLG